MLKFSLCSSVILPSLVNIWMAGAPHASQVEVNQEEPSWTKPLGGPRGLYTRAPIGLVEVMAPPARWQKGIPETFSRSCESPAGQGLSIPVCLLPAHSCISILLWMILSHSHPGIWGLCSAPQHDWDFWSQDYFTAMDRTLSIHQCPITGQQLSLKGCVHSSWLQELMCPKAQQEPMTCGTVLLP